MKKLLRYFTWQPVKKRKIWWDYAGWGVGLRAVVLSEKCGGKKLNIIYRDLDKKCYITSCDNNTIEIIERISV